MKFPYYQFISRLPGSSDFQLSLRPVISIRVIGPLSARRWDALLDTGADEPLFPASLAPLLGVSLVQDMTGSAEGITGERLPIHYGEVEMEIADANESCRWKTIVGFVDFGESADEMIILGHGGCLDYFTAIFDGEKAEVELLANSYLPR